MLIVPPNPPRLSDSQSHLRQLVIAVTAKFHGRSDYGPTTIPELMEHGDTVRGRDTRMHRYEARPFMGPAYEENLPKLPAMWRDSVR